MKRRGIYATVSLMVLLILCAGFWFYKDQPLSAEQLTTGVNDVPKTPVIEPQKVTPSPTPPAPKDNVNDAKKENSDLSNQQKQPTQSIAEPSSNEKLGWYYKPNSTHQLPEVSQRGKELLEKYQGIYCGNPNDQKIYLTFDEGYENGYTPQILDALKEANVKAAFFITGDYLRRNPELVHRMVREGHIVGNHTDNHPSLPTVSDEKLKKEIASLSAAFSELTGGQMSFLRPPMGEYSERTLELTHAMGYRNVFWTVAFADWEPNAGSPEENLNRVLTRLHPGAVVLLHAVNKANSEMLPTLIQKCRDQGYQFATLDQIN